MRPKRIIGTSNRLGALAKQRKTFFSWLAACIDCDGSIYWAKYKENKEKGWKATMYPAIKFTNTNKEIVEEVATLFRNKVHIVGRNRVVKSTLTGTHYLTVYEVSIQRQNDVADLLERIYPYLIVKRQKAKEVLEWLEKKFDIPYWRKGREYQEKLKKWAIDYDCCQVCARTDRHHSSRGLCFTCYRAWLRKTGRVKK